MNFSDRDVEDFSNLVGLIYETVIDDTRWPETLEGVCRFVGASASRIYWRDASNAEAQTIYSWGFKPEFLEIYRRGYVALNPLYPASVFINPGEVFSSQDLVPPDEFQSSRFFREWVAPQGFFDAAIFNIQRYQASAAAFTVITGRDYGAVDARLRQRLQLLAPHLQRAALIGRELDRRGLHAQSLEAALNRVEAGVFILDAAGRAVWVNHVGEAMLEKGDVVRDAQRFILADAAANQRLREGLVASLDSLDQGAAPQPAVIKTADAQGAAWMGCLMRLPAHSVTRQAFQQVGPAAQAALFLRPADVVPASGLEACARLYGLTRAELRVLNAALEIDTVANIADTLGVSTNTVKKQLSAVFAKMGVSRRAALVKAVMTAQSAA
jgi:DNA-binding CsgD family transcriptional regulator